MSRRFWTADWHLGHGNIIEYCGRPFKSIDSMTSGIVQSSNSRVGKDDLLIHVGDFCTRGKARGVEGSRKKWTDYTKLMNGMVVLLEGNHDDQNKTKTAGMHMVVEIAGMPVFVSHYPTDAVQHDPMLIEWVHEKCSFAICGHVHEKWMVKWDKYIPNINVGWDQHRMPISDDEVVNIYNKAMKEYAK